MKSVPLFKGQESVVKDFVKINTTTTVSEMNTKFQLSHEYQFTYINIRSFHKTLINFINRCFHPYSSYPVMPRTPTNYCQDKYPKAHGGRFNFWGASSFTWDFLCPLSNFVIFTTNKTRTQFPLVGDDKLEIPLNPCMVHRIAHICGCQFAGAIYEKVEHTRVGGAATWINVHI